MVGLCEEAEELTKVWEKILGGWTEYGGDGGSDLMFSTLVCMVIELLITVASTVHRVARGLVRW